MSILSKHLEFVKAHIAVQQKLAKKFAPGSKYHNPSRYELHLANIESFSSLLKDLEGADAELDVSASSPRTYPKGPVQLQLLPQDLEGLPEELIEELSVQNVDRLEMAIYTLFTDAGGILSLDRVLINLYRKSGEVHKRSAITSKLYRMVQKGMLFNVPFRKGWYSTEEMSEERANELFGGGAT